jgi:hypothetical protein
VHIPSSSFAKNKTAESGGFLWKTWGMAAQCRTSRLSAGLLQQAMEESCLHGALILRLAGRLSSI